MCGDILLLHDPNDFAGVPKFSIQPLSVHRLEAVVFMKKIVFFAYRFHIVFDKLRCAISFRDIHTSMNKSPYRTVFAISRGQGVQLRL